MMINTKKSESESNVGMMDDRAHTRNSNHKLVQFFCGSSRRRFFFVVGSLLFLWLATDFMVNIWGQLQPTSFVIMESIESISNESSRLSMASSRLEHPDLPLDYRQVAFQLAQQRANARSSSSSRVAGKEQSSSSSFMEITTSSILHDNLQELYPRQNNFTKADLVKSPRIVTVGNQTMMPREYLKFMKEKNYVLNLVRVPKASSSALSVAARALAGCKPDGFPCCSIAMEKKTCPLEGLMCDVIRGCTDHRPKYTQSRNYPSLTMLREPTSRLLSGFFYVTPHRPQHYRGNYSWELFESEYIPVAEFRNVLTKMLNGQYSYHDFNSTIATVEGAKSRLCQITAFGFSGKPVALALLLYESGQFQTLQPHPVVFELPPPSSNVTGKRTKSKSLRVDKSERYTLFKSKTFIENNGKELVEMYNQEDIEVYNFAKKLYCARVREAGLLEATKEVGLLPLYEECIIAPEEFLINDNGTSQTATTTTTDLCGPYETY